MLNIAVILAGGSGQRAGGCIPKQFKKINDKTILVYSLEKFNSAPSIDEITVVIHPEWRRECEHILSDCRISKVKHLLDGGKERYHSVLAALKFYAGRPCNLLIHDAVRPLVTQRIIEEVITELQTYKAVNVAIPATDTIILILSNAGTSFGIFCTRYKLLKDFTTKLYKRLMPWH